MLFKECWINNVKKQTNKQYKVEKIKKCKNEQIKRFQAANDIVTASDMGLLVFIAEKRGGMGLFPPWYTAQNTKFSHNFRVWKFYRNAQFSLRKVCGFPKFPHHEIRWNLSILHHVCDISYDCAGNMKFCKKVERTCIFRRYTYFCKIPQYVANAEPRLIFR